MIGGLGGHYAVAAAMAQNYAAQNHLANIGGLGQLQQAGINQMYQNSLREKHKTREEKILDMETDLYLYLNKSKKF